MLRDIDLRGSHAEPRSVLPRAALDVEEATQRVRPVIEDVRERGAAAVMEWTERFDAQIGRAHV